MRRKLIKIGDSSAVTIPKKSLEELGLKEGDEVTLDIDKKTRAVTIKPAFSVDPELLEWTDRFIKRYRSALDALSRK